MYNTNKNQNQQDVHTVESSSFSKLIAMTNHFFTSNWRIENISTLGSIFLSGRGRRGVVAV